MPIEKMKIELTMLDPTLGSLPGNPSLTYQHIMTKVLEEKGKSVKDEQGKNVRVLHDALADDPAKVADELASHPNADLTEEVLATLSPEERTALQTTVFARSTTDVSPVFKTGPISLKDYVFRGFFKEAILVQIELGQSPISKWGVRRLVDNAVFVNPRYVPFLRDGKPIYEPDGYCERPLRVEMGMGSSKVCLARSEQIAEGATLTFDVHLLIPQGEKAEKKSMMYGLNREVIEAALEYGSLKGLGQWRNSGMGRFSYKILS